MRKLLVIGCAFLGLAGGTAHACDGVVIAYAPSFLHTGSGLRPGYVLKDIDDLFIPHQGEKYYCGGDQMICYLASSIQTNCTFNQDPIHPLDADHLDLMYLAVRN